MRALLSTASLLALSGLASAQIPALYTQDFEGLVQTDPAALANDGWFNWEGVFDDMAIYQYGFWYGPAANQINAWQDITTGQGGAAQGAQQLVVYSDYANPDHNNLDWQIESNVYREWTVDAADVGKTYRFTFEVKRGDLVPPSGAKAFIKVVNNLTFDLSGSSLIATESQPTTWQTLFVELTIDATQVGHFFQIGFLSQASNFDPCGVIYDNLVLEDITITAPIGSNYCNVNPTSTGNPSIMSAAGSASIAANNLVISCDNIANNEPGVFFYGMNQGQFPFGEGFRCVTGTIFRLWPPAQSNGGTLTRAINYNNLPTPILAGSTWNFQGWFRDPSGGPSGFNLSDGLEIPFLL